VGGIFHPSGNWLFIADRQARGIWTIPVTANSLAAERSSFVAANIGTGIRFAFSFAGKYLYIAQQDGPIVDIQGFQVDEATGVLTRISGSPWIIKDAKVVTSMVELAPTN